MKPGGIIYITIRMIIPSGKNNKEFYNANAKNVDNYRINDIAPKQTLESLKEIIYRIDNKIGFSNTDSRSSSFISNKNKDIFDNLPDKN